MGELYRLGYGAAEVDEIGLFFAVHTCNEETQHFLTEAKELFVSVHIRAQNGVDTGLVSTATPEPPQQVGVEAHRHHCLRMRQNDFGILPKVLIRNTRVGIRLDTLANLAAAKAPRPIPICSCPSLSH